MPPLHVTAAALLTWFAATDTASAQLPVMGTSPATTPTVAPLPTASRTIATYRLHTTGRALLPAEVTLADSAGVLVARYRLVGDRTSHPMSVTVIESDLVLQGDSPAGVVTLRLDRLVDLSPGQPFTGTWWVDEVQGTLRGRMGR